MSSNRLSLNANKTQVIWFVQQLLKSDLPILTYRFPSFIFHSSVRNLGVVLDSTLTFSEHVATYSLTSYFQGGLEQSFINSGHFYSAPSSPPLLRGAPDHSTDTVSEFHAKAPQATAGKGLSQGPYVTTRAVVEPTTLRLKVIASTKAPPHPTISFLSYLYLLICPCLLRLLSNGLLQFFPGSSSKGLSFSSSSVC